MQSRSLASNLGIYAYAAGAIFLGLLGLVSGEFATTWQHIDPAMPLYHPLACVAALIELAAGIALLVPRTARIGAATLTMVFAIFTLLWVPKILENPRVFDPIGNFFEELSLVLAGAALFASLSAQARHERLIARLYGLCPISFGVGHIIAMPGLLTWIPKWLPPSQLFWAYFTTISFFLIAAAILTGILATLAARLLTAEILCFELFVWIPFLIANPTGHFYWAGNAINVAMLGAAWAVSDSLARTVKDSSREERIAGPVLVSNR